MPDWTWPDFTPDEMRCKGSGLLIVSNRFMEHLQSLRTLFGKPMHITSACRSAEHNRAVGGHLRSLHVCDMPQHPGQDGCMAVDVAMADGAYRGRLFALAWDRGWSIGWNARMGFLHLDRRVDLGLPQTTFDY